MKPRRLLVDLDGTLLDSYDLPVRAEFIVRALTKLRNARRGRTIAWSQAAQALKAVRIALETPAAQISEQTTNSQRAASALGEALGLEATEADRLLTDAVGGIFPLLKRYFYPVAGARDFIEWAAAHYPLTLATNPVWPEQQVRLRLEWAGIEPSRFELITHARIMHACKPTPQYYRQVLDRLGENEPSECLLVGDDLRKDLPAIRVGIPVFILGQGLKPLSLEGANAPAWQGSFAQLRALLDGTAGPRAEGSSP